MKAIICSLLIFIPAMATAQKAGQGGSVAGTVRNGSKDSAPVPGLDVVLYTVQDGQEVDGPRPHGTTDARGRFVFRELATGENTAYYPLAVYETVQYMGPLVPVTPAAPEQQSNIILFDITTVDTAISATMHHLIIEPGNGMLAMREVYQFTNRGKYTYFSEPLNEQQMRIGLQFEIPKAAQELQLGGNLMSCCTVVQGNRIYNTMEFKPGNKQIVMNYQVPYSGSEASLTKTITATTELLDVYLPEPGVPRMQIRTGDAVRTLALDDGEPFQIRGRSYRRYAVTGVARGSVLSLDLRQLPSAPRDYRWLAPVALVLSVLLGLLWYRRQAKTPSGEAEGEAAPSAVDAEVDRQALVDRILALDEKIEAGEAGKDYLLEREKLVQQVLDYDAKHPAAE